METIRRHTQPFCDDVPTRSVVMNDECRTRRAKCQHFQKIRVEPEVVANASIVVHVEDQCLSEQARDVGRVAGERYGPCHLCRVRT